MVKTHALLSDLKGLKEKLPTNFLQCHHNYIVNSNFIKQINTYNLVIINGDILPITRPYRSNF